MAAAGREAFVSFLDLLFPPKCPFCQKVQNAPGICPACRQSLPWAEPLVKEGASLQLTGQELLDMIRRAIQEGEEA